jgi:hypothetical protein
VHIGSRRTVIVLPSLFVAGVAAVFVVSCSSPEPKASVTASPEITSSQSVTLTPAPSAKPPVTPSANAPSATSPDSAGPSQVPEPRRVNVTTTFAAWNATSGAVEVGGYVAVVEPVGTCTLRLTQGTQVVTRAHTATADATTVACGGFSVPHKELTAGQWQVVLGYTSSRSAGKAAAETVKVP